MQAAGIQELVFINGQNELVVTLYNRLGHNGGY